MAFMGRNFSTPSKSDLSAWSAAQYLWEAGFRFSGSGYHSDAALPRKKQEVEAFIQVNSQHSQKIGHQIKWSEYA
jgi:hypothetical protein